MRLLLSTLYRLESLRPPVMASQLAIRIDGQCLSVDTTDKKRSVKWHADSSQILLQTWVKSRSKVAPMFSEAITLR